MRLEGSSVDDLCGKIPDAIPDILEATARGEFDIPTEIIAATSRRVRGGSVAA